MSRMRIARIEMTPPDPHRRKRLLYQAQHRGLREADLVIGGFAAACLASMTEDEVDAFEVLLSFPDPDLYAWIVGDAPAPAEVDGTVLRRLRAFRPFGG